VLLYTTAYVLFGRALGLPLRLAEGYLPGTFDVSSNAMVVRASDAAVWAQLAIPGVGWQDLFPASTTLTVLVPGKIVYSGIPVAPSAPAPSRSTSSRPGRSALPGSAQSQAEPVLTLVAGFLVLFILLLAALVVLVSLRWSSVGAGLNPLTRFFVRVGVLARLAGIRLRPSDTAAQATVKVATRVPEHTHLLGDLNVRYERMRYGPPGDRGLAENLREQWQRLRAALGRLIVARLWRRAPR
jgi:hypothetical protein